MRAPRPVVLPGRGASVSWLLSARMLLWALGRPVLATQPAVCAGQLNMRHKKPLPLFLVLCTALPAQRWSDLQGRTQSGAVALHQAQLDANNDALVLLVASHPDDRYVLPAVYLRYHFGARVAVLLASRGGGGQNSLGPETGDELERIRTMEAEAGCASFGGDVWYLDRPDRGFRRTAAETFAEWGREETVREVVRLLRTIRPDVVMSTHHGEETHGHDLALADVLPEAVALAADANFLPQLQTHRVRTLFLGATSSPAPVAFALQADEFDAVRGETWRRLAYDVLLRNHVSPGRPSTIGSLFESHTRFAAVPLPLHAGPSSLFDGVPTLLDAGQLALSESQRLSLKNALAGLRGDKADAAGIESAIAVAEQLRSLSCTPGTDAAHRRDRRLDAVLDVVRHADAIQVEVTARPGAAAVPGEELEFDVHVRVGGPRAIDRVSVSAERGLARLDPIDGDSTAIAATSSLHAVVTYSVPRTEPADGEALDARFRGDRFVPPVQLRFSMQLGSLELPAIVNVPVDLKPPVQLTVVPRMLLLPASREEVRFTVKAERHSASPVVGDLDLRASAGYRIEGPRTKVALDTVRSDIFEFSLRAPQNRGSGVDRVRISLGDNRVVLPVHKVDVEIDPSLRVGVVRSLDDALTSVIGAGGFGLHWAGLSDIDLAVGDLAEFDTIVVDVRALRDRPQARQSFRRLLEFCSQRGKRLVVFYHKDVEYEPPGEGFRGAPFQPFEIGRGRVTRADAPVRLLAPEHCLLTRPNAIRAGDWDGWEQERGLYFPSVYASEYEEVLELNDPGLPPERSALLYARTGNGEFVYCALSLWRQLKKLHPGSVRLLANLLSPTHPRD